MVDSLSSFLWEEFLPDYAVQDALQSFALGMLVFHGMGTVLQIFDAYGICQQFKEFKATDKMPTYYEMLPQVLWNQIVILLPCMMITGYTRWTVPNENEVNLTANMNMVLKWFCALIIGLSGHEICFYLTHRFLLHSKWGWTFFEHHVHHSAKTHSSISAMYMSSLDFLVEIVVPFLVPVMVVCALNLSDRFTVITLLPSGTIGGILEHSGYNFLPQFTLTDTAPHARHHRMKNCSYADGFFAPNILDNVFETNCAPMFTYTRIKETVKEVYLWVTNTSTVKSD